MADGVILNSGSGGATAATDDCGAAGHTQVMKLAISTDGSATLIPADATNGLQVNVTKVVPGTAATNLGKAEDAAAANGDTGVAALTVRQDTLASSTSADGDYQFLKTTAAGRVYASATIDAALPAGAATIGAVNLAQYTPASGRLPVDGSGVTQPVSGTVAVSSLTAGASSIAKAEDVASADADVGVPAMAVRKATPANTSGTDGDYEMLQMSAGRLWVDPSGVTLTVASHAVTNAGTFAVQAAQSGTWTVQIGNTANTTPILASIHDGTTKASVADLTNSNPLHVALVDTNGDQISSFGGGTQYTEDAAAAANPVGTAVMLVRDDTPGALVSADGDNVAQRGTNFGAAFVQVVDSSGNFIDTFGGSGGTAAADDADFTATSTQGTPVMGVYESSPTSVTDGDMGVVGITQTRALKVAIASGGVSGKVDDAAFTAASDEGVLLMGVASSDTVDSGDAGAVAMTTARELKVSLTTALPAGTAAIGKLAANSGVDIGDVDVTSVTPGTAAGNLGKAEDAAHASGDTGVMALAVRTDTATQRAGTDGDYSPLTTDANGRLHVITGPSTGTIEVVGDVADDAATSGNPVLVAGVAVETDGTDPTTVSAEGDAAYLRTDRARRLLVSEQHPRFFNASADYGSAQSNASLQSAPGASLSLYITDIVISNGATAGKITLLDGSGGTVKFTLYPAINGGVAISLRNPIRLTANTALCVTSTAVTTHAVNVSGYIAP